MKTLLFVIAAAILTLNAVEDLPIQYENNYCAVMEDGILSITHEGSKMGSDVTLSNGTMIKLTGEVILKSGSKLVLKPGDCVDNEGNIIANPDKKVKQEP